MTQLQLSIGVQMEAIIELNPVRWRTDAPRHIAYADDGVLVSSTVTG